MTNTRNDTTIHTVLTTHRKASMRGFILGTIFGLVLATVGFSGIMGMLDKGVNTIKTQSQELAK